MDILIRCDSSNIIGTGHVMRCLNLCENNLENNYTFLCRNFNMNISDKIIEKGHRLILLDYNIEPELEKYNTWIGVKYNEEINDICKILKNDKYDEVIIDHYGIDFILERKIRDYCKKIKVISDIFNYSHYVDEYINYNCDDMVRVRAINLNVDTVYKIGIENLIVNKRFKGKKKIIFNKDVKLICIMMGGSDPFNYTLKVIKEINDIVIELGIRVYVILGKSNSHEETIREYVSDNYKIERDLNYDDLIELYLKVDLCIGSLSVTAYERLLLGVPQICLKIVDNQNIQNREEFNICKIDNLRNLFKRNVYIQ